MWNAIRWADSARLSMLTWLVWVWHSYESQLEKCQYFWRGEKCRTVIIGYYFVSTELVTFTELWQKYWSTQRNNMFEMLLSLNKFLVSLCSVGDPNSFPPPHTHTHTDTKYMVCFSQDWYYYAFNFDKHTMYGVLPPGVLSIHSIWLTHTPSQCMTCVMPMHSIW